MNVGIGPGSDAKEKQDAVEDSLMQLFPNLERLLINSERQTLRGIRVPIISLDQLLMTRKPVDGVNSDPKALSSAPSSATQSHMHCVSINEDMVEDMLEWIGCMHNRVRTYMEGAEIDPAVSLVSPVAMERSLMHGLVFRHEGFLIPSWILQQLERAKSVVDAGHAPYAILTTWAFVDQPMRNLMYFRDAHYTIIILPGDAYVVMQPSQQ